MAKEFKKCLKQARMKHNKPPHWEHTGTCDCMDISVFITDTTKFINKRSAA